MRSAGEDQLAAAHGDVLRAGELQLARAEVAVVGDGIVVARQHGPVRAVQAVPVKSSCQARFQPAPGLYSSSPCAWLASGSGAGSGTALRSARR